MSKTKKGFQPPTSAPAGADPSAGADASDPATQPPAGQTSGDSGSGSTPPSGSRAAARRGSTPVKVSPEPASFFEKYRLLLLVGLVVLGLGVVGLVFMQSATAAPYTCITLLTPGPVEPVPTPRAVPSVAATAAPSAATSAAPAASAASAASAAPSAAPAASAAPTASPEPQPTQRLGFVAQDLGRDHVGASESITYAYCPPTSGKHFNVQNLAPLRRDFYGPTDQLKPGNWIHNLEHGYVVLLYKGDPGKEIVAQLEQVMESAAPGALAQACALPNKVIAVRFDDLSQPFAAVSWDRALLLPEFDAAQLKTFAEQWQDSPVAPEQAC